MVEPGSRGPASIVILQGNRSCQGVTEYSIRANHRLVVSMADGVYQGGFAVI